MTNTRGPARRSVLGRVRIPERNQRGASLVEGALVLPIVAFLIFSIIQGALLFRAYLSVQNAASSGARAGSIAANTPQSDFQILQAVAKAATGAGVNQIDYVLVYKASEPGAAPSAACKDAANRGDPAGVAGECNVYINNGIFKIPASAWANGSVLPSQAWPATTRKVSQSKGTDYIGVYVQMQCGCMGEQYFGIKPELRSTSVQGLEASEV